jgi:hypothetical protein
MEMTKTQKLKVDLAEIRQLLAKFILLDRGLLKTAEVEGVVIPDTQAKKLIEEYNTKTESKLSYQK